MKGNWKKSPLFVQRKYRDWSIAKIEACVFAIRINGDGTIFVEIRYSIAINRIKLVHTSTYVDKRQPSREKGTEQSICQEHVFLAKLSWNY